jgi:hypothetical protein
VDDEDLRWVEEGIILPYDTRHWTKTSVTTGRPVFQIDHSDRPVAR